MRLARIVTGWIGTGNPGDSFRPVLPFPLNWQDVTGQSVQIIIDGKPLYTIEVTCSEAELETLKTTVGLIVLWDTDADKPTPPADLDAAGIENLKTRIASLYYSDVAELVTQNTTNPATVEQNLKTEVQLRPPWKVGIAVLVGDVYQYGDNVFQVIQAHTTQSDWTPDRVPALFKRYYEPSDNPWPWVQPLGAHDAYPLDARVLHNGYTWKSLYAANVWEPGVFGWENLTPPEPTNEWSYPVAYKVGDIVTYQGIEYRCLQAHTSISVWTPPAVPALWLRL